MPHLQMYEVATASTAVVRGKVTQAPFNDPRVRKALRLAIVARLPRLEKAWSRYIVMPGYGQVVGDLSDDIAGARSTDDVRVRSVQDLHTNAKRAALWHGGRGVCGEAFSAQLTNEAIGGRC